MPSASRPACLVTGCAGFVGSHLTDTLLAMGFSVVGVDIRPASEARNLAEAFKNDQFHYVERDITHHEVLASATAVCPDIQYVFHLAAVVMVAFSMEHPELTMATNYTATKALHEEAMRAGAKAFIFAGSAAEYGDDPRLPLREEYATAETVHNSPYGRSKYLSSTLMQESGFGCSLRFFNIFGPRQDPSSPYSGVVSKFITQAVAGEDMTIFGDGGQTRDFIYVSDVVQSYLIAAGIVPAPSTGSTAPLGGIFNVGTGNSISIKQLADKVVANTGKGSSILFGPCRAGDIYHSQADISRFTRQTGFKATVPFEEGLDRTINWMRTEQID
ncbi:NAD-dependent epimerase/dehydratase family protein [Desulfovibrio mangrovi]|uniref:NAD-dependent epimerase/dehydratase family protein n=1 Tax=Desulfovibrio mangrovi TaxID=2976983 RepID=UPI002245DFB7|nr:NAD-dependent epimerase/dehydratase family protein [Desulfovibrio mangrovi]UZP67393.1 NAD-dependent epimerase/dehydratase family protein [Desulfovibrio mangrovi]